MYRRTLVQGVIIWQQCDAVPGAAELMRAHQLFNVHLSSCLIWNSRFGPIWGKLVNKMPRNVGVPTCSFLAWHATGINCVCGWHFGSCFSDLFPFCKNKSKTWKQLAKSAQKTNAERRFLFWGNKLETNISAIVRFLTFIYLMNTI